MADYQKPYDNADDDARAADQVMLSGAKNAIRFNQAAHTSNAAAKSTKVGRVAATAGKGAAAKAALGKANILGLKIKLAICGIVLFAILLTAALETMPSLIGNSVLHVNDPETLSDGGDITSYKDYDESMELMDKRIDSSKQVITNVLSEAYSDTYTELANANISVAEVAPAYASSSILAEVVIDMGSLSPVMPNSLTKQAVVMIISGYSASMQNALGDFAFEYYQGINEDGEMLSALTDLDDKITVLKDTPSEKYPYGNFIFGGDFLKSGGQYAYTLETVTFTYTITTTETADGKLIPRCSLSSIVSSTQGSMASSNVSMNTAPSGRDVIDAFNSGASAITVTVYRLHITPVIYQVGWTEFIERGFDIKLSDPYFENSIDTSTTYNDVIISMCNVLGEELYGEEWGSLGGMSSTVYSAEISNKLVATARAQLHQGGADNAFLQWFYGGSAGSHSDWSAVFISWCANECGLGDVIPKCASALEFEQHYSRQGLFHSASSGYTPVAGDLVTFDFDGDGTSDYIAIVVSCIGDTLNVIGGNILCDSHNEYEVVETSYSMSDSSIVGFCSPDYPYVLGIDTASPIDVANAAALKSLGYEFVGRYLKYGSGWNYKFLTYEETGIIHDAGLAILPIYEIWGDDMAPYKVGNSISAAKTVGRNHAISAMEAAAYYGIPNNGTVCIYFAIECWSSGYAPHYDNGLPYVEAYFQGINEVLAGQYLVGCYGTYYTVEALETKTSAHIDAYWQCVGGSMGNISGYHDIYQAVGTTRIDGVTVSVDINTCPDLAAAHLW